VTVTEAVEAVRELSSSILERRGYELVDVALAREGRRTLLRVTVDHPGQPVGLEEISRISEEISRALDDLDPIEQAYTLEVSSAGIERPLIKPTDYARFEQRDAKVKTREPIEGRRNFQGQISRAGDESFVLELGDQVVEIPYSAVMTAKLVVDWDAELRRASEETG
jgi:ribosome maturation factor RimP